MAALKRILLVEDDARDLELTIAALADQNLVTETVAVHDGAEALDYLYARGLHARREPGLPAVVLLDIKMPRLTGIEVLRAMRADPALRAIPVVMLTSSREEADLKDSYALGVNAYVVKPVTLAEYLDTVRHLAYFWGVINEVPVIPGVGVPRR